MTGSNKFRDLLLYLPGLVVLSLGVYLVIKTPQVDYVINRIRESSELVEGRRGFKYWKDVDIYVYVYMFHVNNPVDVMEGRTPKFKERGPYVYNMHLKKNVISVDTKKDTMNFTTFRTYVFNRTASAESDEEIVTILNSGYLGTITTLADQFPMFIGKLGNAIINLFPKANDIFLRAKVKDILFDGVPLVCDKEKYSDLSLICGFLKGNKPPVIKDTDTPNNYLFSIFSRLNMTDQGPFTVNRGVHRKYALGNITSFKNLTVTKYWNEPGCNLVSGTDAITWPPMTYRLPYVTVYEPTICRTVTPVYRKDVVVHGLLGYHYESDNSQWSNDSIGCYCPVNKKTKDRQCLPIGLMDISKCQGVPIVYSEPHFRNGHVRLLDYAKGLHPNPSLHRTYIDIEPISGAPLSGSKQIQLNVLVKPISDITLMSNLSVGMFPLLWVDETSTASLQLLEPIIMAHRLIHVFQYSSWIPIVIGTFIIVKVWWLRPASDIRRTAIVSKKIETDRSISHSNQRHVQRPEKRRRHAFD